MKLRFPTPVVNAIIDQINIDIDFHQAPEIVKQKVFKQCINLWWFIYNEAANNRNTTTLKGYTNIHSSKLKKYCICHEYKRYSYVKFLDILISCGLVEANDIYSAGTFPKSYRVTINFGTGVDTTEIEIDFDVVFNNNRNKSHWLKLYPQYADLIKDCYRAKVDLNSYTKWLYQNVGLKLKSKCKKGFIVKRFLTPERIIKYINNAIKLNVGNLWFGTSEQGRFYSSITGLSSTAIPFLKLNKQSLVSLDIANSQPLLLATIIDCPSYTKVCEEGEFYKSIVEHTGETKDDVKAMVMKTFFRAEQCHSGIMVDCLNELYPGLVDQLNELKSKMNVAHHLHQLEAGIIVTGCGSLNFPKLLRHDQVLVYRQHENEVRAYITNEFKSRGTRVSLS